MLFEDVGVDLEIFLEKASLGKALDSCLITQLLVLLGIHIYIDIDIYIHMYYICIYTYRESGAGEGAQLLFEYSAACPARCVHIYIYR